MIYLITFACYGCHLHGETTGSVDPDHNVPGSRLLGINANRTTWERLRMDQAPYSMDEPRRNAVLAALLERCSSNDWRLLAAHVRTNHVHVVVDAKVRPERVMNDLKSFASRRLNERAMDTANRKRWARHGSTRWLWNRDAVLAAIRYVIDKQGAQMAVHESLPSRDHRERSL